MRGLDILNLQLFVLHTDTISFPLFNSPFLRYNKQTLFVPKHTGMISESPSTDLSAVEARQFAWALWRQSHSTHEDNHVFSSLWTPTSLTDQVKEAVTGYVRGRG